MTRRAQQEKPAYVVHEVRESDVTVDWFYGSARWGTKIFQLIALLVAWFFAILPIVITTSALIHRDDPDKGWWNYSEGFWMFDTTMVLLAILFVIFVIGFLVLYLAHRHGRRERAEGTTYDAERLEQRLQVADHWYATRFGPAELRQQERSIRIEPYGDLGTYELRDQYRSFGVD